VCQFLSNTFSNVPLLQLAQCSLLQSEQNRKKNTLMNCHVWFDTFHTGTYFNSVVTVAGICNSVGGGVFLDMPPRWQISVRVKARVDNWKQVDVAASTSFDLSGNALIAHCTQRDGGGALSETVATVSLSTVPRLFLLWQSYRLQVGSGREGGGQAVSPTDLIVRSPRDQMMLRRWWAVFRKQRPKRPSRTL